MDSRTYDRSLLFNPRLATSFYGMFCSSLHESGGTSPAQPEGSQFVSVGSHCDFLPILNQGILSSGLPIPNKDRGHLSSPSFYKGPTRTSLTTFTSVFGYIPLISTNHNKPSSQFQSSLTLILTFLFFLGPIFLGTFSTFLQTRHMACIVIV